MGTIPDNQLHEMADGAVRVWIEQEAIHLVAYDRASHDPVELTANQARDLSAKLQELAATLDD